MESSEGCGFWGTNAGTRIDIPAVEGDADIAILDDIPAAGDEARGPSQGRAFRDSALASSDLASSDASVLDESV